MDKNEPKKNDLLRRPLYLYSLPPEVLDSLVYADITGTAAAAAQDLPASKRDGPPRDAPESSPSAGPACALCSLVFATALEQRSHAKSDLHHYNLKQKMRGAAAVTEAEFEQLVGNLDESLSGSEGSESDESDDPESGGGPSSGADSAASSDGGNVLASLLKRQAVLAEKQRRQEGGGSQDKNADGYDGWNPNRTLRARDKAAVAAAASSIHPFVWFRSPLLPENSYFGVYRVLFTPDELGGDDDVDGETKRSQEEDTRQSTSDRLRAAIVSRQLAPISQQPPPQTAQTPGYTGRHFFLCMIGGGHFAAMVVALAPRKARAGSVPLNREATVLAHKTFHRYTTRRKQGGSQSANDNAKGAAHSAGSSLRRYNEQALVEDVRALLLEWRALLDSAELLFVRATGTTNRRTLFGPYDGQVLHARDPRLRSFPFNTRRPTQNEMMRAFIELTRLKVREGVQEAVDAAEAAEAAAAAAAAEGQAKGRAKQSSQSQPAGRSEEEETALLHTAQLQALARRSKVPALLAYLQANALSAATFRFAPADAPQHHHAPTLLHLAAAQNAPALVTALILRAGADPRVPNADNRTPFELAGDRATRDAFRVARAEYDSTTGSLGAIDWDGEARVPPPLARAEAEQRDAREKQEQTRQEAERRRAEEARLQAEAATKASHAPSGRKKTAATVGMAKSAQEFREDEARGLTPEQRQRLERERRARAAEERMRRMRTGG